MDYSFVFGELAKLFIRICSVEVTIFGVTFLCGTLFLFCALGVVIIAFMKGLAN